MMIGSTVSHYKILEKLGEGGMGVVYKAEDTKLDRFVALKFLPSHLNASGQDKARFVQEAKAAAALNHPNVCSIIDIQEHEGQMFIVMEFVDGQTLGEKRGSISFKQAIDIGIQIADGLSAAHEKGIVHRDIKPDNIMIRKDGIAQITDFGLAKLRGNVSRLTKEGSTVGTAGYMSPEQVQGLETDHRADIFSLGVLLYELFTGQLPFKGVHETALMYEIVNVDPPPMSVVKPEIDPALDAIVLECLEKDPNERTQSVKQLSIDLKRFKRESSRSRVSRITSSRPAYQPPSASSQTARQAAAAELPGREGSTRTALIPWIVSAILAIGLGGISFIHFREAPPQVTSITSSILPAEHTTFFNANDGGHIALSPDGSVLAFVASDTSGKKSLWLRPLSSSSTQQLPETDGAEYPFWSPDSRFIGFFAAGKLKKVAASGGGPLTICDAPNGRGGTWNQEGVIIFAPRFDNTGLFRVSAAGGEAAPLTVLDSTRNETNHRWPLFMPDGKHFTYTTQAKSRTSEYAGAMYVSSLDGSMNRLLAKISSNMVFDGKRLLYVRQGALVAHPFDLNKYDFSGDAFPITEKIEYSSDKSRGMLSISQNGLLVYQVGGDYRRLPVWYDRTGKRLSTVSDRAVSSWGQMSLDGTKIALDSPDPQAKTSDIWILDLTRGLSTRFTFDKSDDLLPIWSPDGSRIVFASDREGHMSLFIKNSSGTETEAPFFKTDEIITPDNWSADGRFIMFQSIGLKTNWDLWIIPAEGERKPSVFLKTEFNEENARFSPDGRWVAYQSDESGKNEVYVRPFPTGSGKWQVSTNGGQFPMWRRDGRELFYYTVDGSVLSAEVNGAGAMFTVGNVQPLFNVPVSIGSLLSDVSADGQRFLMFPVVGAQSVPPLTLVTNWDKELGKK
jgi:eukaryotic-like serine/threonine-protein kinase